MATRIELRANEHMQMENCWMKVDVVRGENNNNGNTQKTFD